MNIEEYRDFCLSLPGATEELPFGPALGYFFRSNDPSRKSNFNLRTMHFINKLSMAMFLVGLGVLLYRWFIR